MNLHKDDRLTIGSAVLSAVVAWYDPTWRWFWIITAVAMAAWTIVAMLSRRNG